MTTRLRFAGIMLASFASIGLAAPAFAQHVVTDNEAAKLTLEALTAPPPRPVVHHVVLASRFRHGSSRHGRTTVVAVRNASYRHLVHTASAHKPAGHSTSHHRGRHHT